MIGSGPFRCLMQLCSAPCYLLRTKDDGAGSEAGYRIRVVSPLAVFPKVPGEAWGCRQCTWLDHSGSSHTIRC